MAPISITQTALTASPVLTEPPEPLITATPDPNQLSFSAEIDRKPTQEEIAEILYTKWFDHFMDERISLEMRLDGYTINDIQIPVDQKCAGKLGGAFITEAQVTVNTFLPLVSTLDEARSNFFIAGGGNIIDEDHQSRSYSSVIFQSGDVYTLSVITQIPMCD